MIAVDLAFATGQVDLPDRLAAWQELVNRVFLPLAITPTGNRRGSGAFEASVNGRGLGGIQVWLVKASPMSAVRTRQHVRASGHDDYLLALHITGTAHGHQDGREVTLGPGDFALFDSGRPYSISFTGPGGFEHVIYQVPRASLDARGTVSTATALRVCAASSAGQLTSPYLRTLARPGLSAHGPVPARPFIDAGLDLAVSALRSVAGYADQAGPLRRAMATDLRDYALAHLGDPGLSPQTVARAGYVSVRQFHRLFAADGLTFGRWVREQRLRRCRDDLADQRLSHLTVAEIAARWGFRSAAHFTRAFRARYGVTPVDYRRACAREGRRDHGRAGALWRPCMPVDPQFRVILDTLETSGLLPLVRGDAVQTRAHYRTLSLLRRGPQFVPEQVASVASRRSPGGVPVRVFEPMRPGGFTLVYLHGGGWVVGDVETHDPLCRRVANATGARLVSVDYRLAPEHPFPAGLDDAEDVLRCLRAQDPGRPVGVAGDSAGASLAAGLAIRAREARIPLAAQLLLYPATDPAMTSPSIIANGAGYFLTRQDLAWFYRQYLPAGAAGAAEADLAHADVAGVAPAIVATAEFDPLRDEGAAYAGRLQDAGVPTRHVPGPGLIHGFAGFLGVVDAADATVRAILEILTRTMRS